MCNKLVFIYKKKKVYTEVVDRFHHGYYWYTKSTYRIHGQHGIIKLCTSEKRI